MTAKTLKKSLFALSAVTLLAASAPSLAGDYQLWRHQVSSDTGNSSNFVLSERTTTPSNDKLWREQVQVSSDKVFKQSRTQTASTGQNELPDYRFWRQQHGPSTHQEAQQEVAMESASSNNSQ